MNNLKNYIKESFVFKFLRTKYLTKNHIKITSDVYKKFYGRELNLKYPRLLSEKIQCLKLFNYPQNLLVIQAADKYTLHEYLSRKQMKHLSVEYINIFEKSDYIDIGQLPEAFVLKKTNASGMNLIIKNKNEINNEKINKIVQKWFKTDFGLLTSEWHYSKAKDRVICEPYFQNLGNEYRIAMIKGNIAFIQVILWDWDQPVNDNEDTQNVPKPMIIEGHRKHYRAHYDEFWNLIWKDEDTPDINIQMPINWKEMVDISTKIGKDFPFVRVDFNIINGQLKITELTFTPASGFLELLRKNFELDKSLGEKLEFNYNEKYY
ncbi:ATP-grasp fold amidoligase family protein [Candidatus Enterococcus willemsii]|uniref:ATP-grasp fold amidoligase family protein n=1 Tax=Candidatus Enterococcus willemsii TaxID=1857215 RepID=UPI001F30FDFF|nr:ATP-grasp fold amidoligase family protein [Enterococcus sp. CU12B]